MKLKNIVGFFIGFGFVTLLIWLNGFNFDQRGSDLALWLYFSTICRIITAIISNFTSLEE